MLIIGITGTLGAGKGTVVEYLVEKKGFTHYSVRSLLLKEINRRGMPGNRDSMVVVANELRSKYGPSYVTDQLYSEAALIGKNCIIESIRTPGEIESLRKKGGFSLFAVDAAAGTRYQRIVERSSETDHISYITFLENEAREMNATDPNKQNLKACIRQADFVFNNDGSKEELYRAVEKVLEELI
ncbi:MAG: AAA family ATPase [Bacteroidales bacterium]